MGLVSTLLGCVAMGTLALSLATNRPYNKHPDAVLLAWAMMFVWLICTVADTWLTPPESKALNAPLDAALGVWVLLLFVARHDRWKLPLLFLLVLQGVMHFVYQTKPLTPGILWWYTLGLNVTFVAELVCIAWPGGRHALELWGRHGGALPVRSRAGPDLGARRT